MRKHERSVHGIVTNDPYSWLQEKDNPEVIAWLTEQNTYAEAQTEHLEPLRDALFHEIKSRIKETDLSVPVAKGNYWYYARTIEGKQYALSCRCPRKPGEPRPSLDEADIAYEQVLIDGNVEAEGRDFFSLGASAVSTDEQLLAFSVDASGDERFDLVIRRIDDKTVIDDAVRDIGYGIVWSADSSYVFYTRVDDAWRPHQVWRHKVGTPASDDVLVHTEDDEEFWMGIGRSRDRNYLVIQSGSKTTDEVWLLRLTEPTNAPFVVNPRRDGLEYMVEPNGDQLFIVHNRDNQDFSIATTQVTSPTDDNWQEWITAQKGERLLGVDAFTSHVVVSLRSQSLLALEIAHCTDDGELGLPQRLAFDEEIYSVGLGANPEHDSQTLIYGFESMVTPRTIFELDVATGDTTVLKQQEVLGDVDLTQYVQRREWAIAADGTRVPLSLVCRKDVVPDGTNPGLLYGYGSYEHSVDPYFSVVRLSLMDRGVVFAIGHIRGGGEMGRSWYLDGKMNNKKNTFSDFVACADHLVDAQWVAPDRLAAQGGSAGGLLIGAAINLAPERFAAVHASVPFVDSLNTMLDPTLPLTIPEWQEWGNPAADKEVYEYMASYAPYENITDSAYPAILATTSLNDTRVLYTEPAKWIAKLQAQADTSPNKPIIMRTEMVAGHGGKSGRYNAWQDTAWELSFLLGQIGASELKGADNT